MGKGMIGGGSSSLGASSARPTFNEKQFKHELQKYREKVGLCSEKEKDILNTMLRSLDQTKNGNLKTYYCFFLEMFKSLLEVQKEKFDCVNLLHQHLNILAQYLQEKGVNVPVTATQLYEVMKVLDYAKDHNEWEAQEPGMHTSGMSLAKDLSGVFAVVDGFFRNQVRVPVSSPKEYDSFDLDKKQTVSAEKAPTNQNDGKQEEENAEESKCLVM